MSKPKKYWRGFEELENDASYLEEKEKEFQQEIPVDEFLGDESLSKTSTSRRDFLKYMGFSVAAASLAACEAPVVKTIPYVNKPFDVNPGVADWFATSFFDGNDFASLLVKSREGRPIKIEGNKKCPITKGGVNARIQASVLSLYDSARLKNPVAHNKSTDWKSVDDAITNKLASISQQGGNIRILSSSIISPSTQQVIEDFKQKYSNTKHVSYDTVSYAGMLEANKNSFGKYSLPSYYFDKAEVIVSFAADFLINWLSPVEFAAQYVQNRKLDKGQKSMSRHIQFETNLSVTGSNADTRVQIKPSETGTAIVNLYNSLAKLAGKSTLSSSKLKYDKKIDQAAKELWDKKGHALVVCGSNDPNHQFIINEINQLLNSYGNTIDMDAPCYFRQGNDKAVSDLIDEMNAGKVDALFIYNCNPAYTLPPSLKFTQALKKVGLKVSFADREDETASLTDYICPDHHYLEGWNDVHPRKGHFAIVQPLIIPIYSTRAAQESLLKWAGNNTDYHTYIKNYWEKNYFPLQSKYSRFINFWNHSLSDGVVMLDESAPEKAAKKDSKKATKKDKTTDTQDTAPSTLSVSDAAAAISKSSASKGMELMLYEKAGIGTGNQANNPWLQELPDPVTRVTWDNYITMSPKQMDELGFNKRQGQRQYADLVNLTYKGITVKLPVVAQPGQTYNTIGLALGYGRTKAGRVANNIGANAYLFSSMQDGFVSLLAKDVSISNSIGKYHIAATQTHHTMDKRDIVQETTLKDYIKDPSSGNEKIMIPMNVGEEKLDKVESGKLSLWKEYKRVGHFWNMSIDLNSCIGCGSCVVSCQAENNIPVVGKDEVRRSRDMYWIRIDRYFSESATKVDKYHIPIPQENPQVFFQPVLCMQCNHAPCESVCPVLATSHSVDGINQMVYNRCVGTRYCANNCPYKVRRFNWFNYYRDEKFTAFNPSQDKLGRMVLNPDVVVRSRGVMEKCSMCAQRIAAGLLKAKMDERPLKDGEIQPACAQSCPTQAIVFGDSNNPKTEVVRLKKEERKYYLLEEVGTQPNVFYQTKVRNV